MRTLSNCVFLSLGFLVGSLAWGKTAPSAKPVPAPSATLVPVAPSPAPVKPVPVYGNGPTLTVDEWRKEYFWLTKPELIKKLNERRIITSVRKIDSNWWMKAAGRTRAPRDFLYEFSQDYERLGQLKDIFQKVEYDKLTKVLRVEQKFLGRVLISQLFLEAQKENDHRFIFFEMINGPFKGSQGIVEFSDIPGQQNVTEVATVSRAVGELKWVPDFAFAMAVEGVMDIVASSMRNLAEEEWAKKQSANLKTGP